MRAIYRTYNLTIIACVIILLFHALLIILIRYYSIEILSGGAQPAVNFDLPLFFTDPSSLVMQSPLTGNTDTATSLLDKAVGGEEETAPEESTENALPTSLSLCSPDAEPQVLESSTLLSPSPLPSLPKKPRRTAHERRAVWHKKSKSENPPLQAQTSPVNPFKNALDLQTAILTKTPSSTRLEAAQNSRGKGRSSYAYDAQEQALATIKAAYLVRITKKLAEQTKFFHHYHYLKEKMAAHTLHIMVEWDKQGKIIDYKLLEEGPNQEIQEVIKDFFMTCTLPSIPPQLSDTFRYFFMVYVEQTPQGFATFTMKAQERR